MIPSALFIQADTRRALQRNAEAVTLYDEGIAIAIEIGAAREEFWGVMARRGAIRPGRPGGRG